MKTVLIDPGHGGKDSGAISDDKKIYEKDRVLDFAKALQNAFQKQGVNAVLTRNSDMDLRLVKRCELENNLNPDCTISCHMDGATSEKACGPTVWIHSKATDDIYKWGQDMIAEIEKVGMTTNRYSKINKGISGDQVVDYYINRYTKSPSMILELGFITNPINLQEQIQNKDKYATATCKATCKFLNIATNDEPISPPDKDENIISFEDLYKLLKEKGITNIKL